VKQEKQKRNQMSNRGNFHAESFSELSIRKLIYPIHNLRNKPSDQRNFLGVSIHSAFLIRNLNSVTQKELQFKNLNTKIPF